MCARHLLHRDFVFEVNHVKGFQKLKNHQLPRAIDGLVREPLANAMDAQPDGEPVEIELSRDGKDCRLIFRDQGDGMTSTNLLALHLLGVSSKR